MTREIKQDVIRGLYLFYGPEEYLVRHYAVEIERLIVDPAARDVCFSLFEEKPDYDAVFDACTAYPMFGERRLVVLKNCGLFKRAAQTKNSSESSTRPQTKSASELSARPQAKSASELSARPQAKSASEPSARAQAFLRELLEKLPEFTCLLIMEQEVDKRLSIYKMVNDKGLAVEFGYRTPYELENWVRAIAGRDGLTFTREALRLFMENAGASMTGIRPELDKLLLYASDKKGITAEDVADACSLSIKTRIFDMLDNAVTGRRAPELAELEKLLRDREPPIKILSALANHLVLLKRMKNLSSGGVKLSEAADLMGLNPYRAEKLWRLSSRVSLDFLARAVDLCFERDVAIKTGKLNDAAALRLLVASMSP